MSFNQNRDVERHLNQVLNSLFQRIMAQCAMLGIASPAEQLPPLKSGQPAQTSFESPAASEPSTPAVDSQRAIQKVIDSVPHYILGLNSQGRCIMTNAAFRTFLNSLDLGMEEVSLERVIYVDSDQHEPATEKILRQAAATGLWTGELYLRKPDSQPNCFQASFFHLETDAFTEMDLEFVGILINISEQKQIEQDLVQTEVMRSIGLLAGGVAHNLNNLLVGVMGYASLLKPHLKSDRKLQKYIQMIENSSSKAAELTRQLLTFSQRGESTPIKLDVNDAIKVAISLVRKMIGRKIEVEVQYAEEPCHIMADPADLEHMILQLSVNAAEAMPDEGQLLIKAGPVTLSQEFLSQHANCEPGPYVRLTITDTGHGIPPDILKNIFHPFFTTREFAHRGMGLSSVFGLAQRYKGVITVASEIDRGTTFEVYLPRFMQEEDHKPSSDGNGGSKNSKKTLLIVDDEKMVLDFFASVLEHEPYNLLFAENGMDALDIFKSDPQSIDLIFMDMIMPRKNGLETYNEMIKIRPDIKVIFSSGFSMDQELSPLIGNGSVDFIRKPFDIRQFLDKLHQATA